MRAVHVEPQATRPELLRTRAGRRVRLTEFAGVPTRGAAASPALCEYSSICYGQARTRRQERREEVKYMGHSFAAATLPSASTPPPRKPGELGDHRDDGTRPHAFGDTSPRAWWARADGRHRQLGGHRRLGGPAIRAAHWHFVGCAFWAEARYKISDFEPDGNANEPDPLPFFAMFFVGVQVFWMPAAMPVYRRSCCGLTQVHPERRWRACNGVAGMEGKLGQPDAGWPPTCAADD